MKFTFTKAIAEFSKLTCNDEFIKFFMKFMSELVLEKNLLNPDTFYLLYHKHNSISCMLYYDDYLTVDLIFDNKLKLVEPITYCLNLDYKDFEDKIQKFVDNFNIIYHKNHDFTNPNIIKNRLTSKT